MYYHYIKEVNAEDALIWIRCDMPYYSSCVIQSGLTPNNAAMHNMSSKNTGPLRSASHQKYFGTDRSFK